MLETLVGTLLLRIIKAWECGDSPLQLSRSPESALVVSCILDLALDDCWSKTASLRHCQMEIIVAFVGNKTWNHFLSTFPSETEHTSMDIMAPIVSLLGHPQTQQQQRCEVLSLVSQVLQAPRFKPLDPNVNNLPQRESPEELGRVMAAYAFPSVLARLDDSSNDVRQKAVQTLGDLLPFVQTGNTSRERPSCEVEGQSDAQNITDGNGAPATIVNGR